ncbi:MAG: FxDxF family PEP-CTERM protein [Burkholderiales bacterium]|nr:FxDxF family PEP-CTERM protein [Burkholderiales bacterium]
MTKTPILAAVAAGFLGLAGNAHALLVNGSFEDNVQANGTWAIYPNLVGWTGGQYGIELRNNVAGAAFDGNNYIELDTTRNSLAYQGVAAVLGQQYLLSFAYSPRTNVAATSNEIEVYWNNERVGTYTGTNNTSGNVWDVKNIYVVGAGNPTELRFVAVGTSDSYGGSLDAVSVTAVPEPEAYGLALAGMGVVAFAMRRRRLD